MLEMMERDGQFQVVNKSKLKACQNLRVQSCSLVKFEKKGVLHLLLRNGNQILLKKVGDSSSDQVVPVDTSFQLRNLDDSFQEPMTDFKGTIELKVSSLRVKL